MNYKINTYQKKDSNFSQLSLFINLSLLFPIRISLSSLRKARLLLKFDNSLDPSFKHITSMHHQSYFGNSFKKSMTASGCGRASLWFQHQNLQGQQTGRYQHGSKHRTTKLYIYNYTIRANALTWPGQLTVMWWGWSKKNETKLLSKSQLWGNHHRGYRSHSNMNWKTVRATFSTLLDKLYVI